MSECDLVAGRRAAIASAMLLASLPSGALSVAVAQEVDFASQHPASISVTLSTDESSYKLGSEILVTIKERNNSSAPLKTNILDNSIDFDLLIRNGATEMEPYPLGLRNFHSLVAPNRPYVLGPGAIVTLPGTHGSSSSISDWGLKITEPGTYILTAVSRETKQKSNPVTISVTH